MPVVADTSPLNYLAWIELASILPALYGNVRIPPEVHVELSSEDAPTVVRAWAKDLPVWIEVCAADHTLTRDLRWQSLDIGERAAIALASEKNAILVIDERAGSRIA